MSEAAVTSPISLFESQACNLLLFTAPGKEKQAGKSRGQKGCYILAGHKYLQYMVLV